MIRTACCEAFISLTFVRSTLLFYTHVILKLLKHDRQQTLSKV